MKIFYGVQGTGNGHITRARVMAQVLKDQGIDVTYMFTGRDRADYFDMEIFGDFICKRGLTFSVKDGKISNVKTVLNNNIFTFMKDVMSLNLDQYDIIITDFEPITAWAGKILGKEVIGIGHQYAFNYKIPIEDSNPIALNILKYFAPVTTGIGLHWHHFKQPILPPIIHVPAKRIVEQDKILVYLPFENIDDIVTLLSPFIDQKFYVYGSGINTQVPSHIKLFNLSRDQFQQDLVTSKGVICNAGFELASEAIQLGKKLLVKPVHGQMEQSSNACALRELEYGYVMQTMNFDTKSPYTSIDNVNDWLYDEDVPNVTYPNVAEYIVTWLLSGNRCSLQTLSDKVWRDVKVV